VRYGVRLGSIGKPSGCVVRTGQSGNDIAPVINPYPILSGALRRVPDSYWPSIHNFWRVGTAIHNFNGCDSQLGTLDSQLDSQLLAGKIARMAISEQRSPFPWCVFALTFYLSCIYLTPGHFLTALYNRRDGRMYLFQFMLKVK